MALKNAIVGGDAEPPPIASRSEQCCREPPHAEPLSIARPEMCQGTAMSVARHGTPRLRQPATVGLIAGCRQPAHVAAPWAASRSSPTNAAGKDKRHPMISKPRPNTSLTKASGQVVRNTLAEQDNDLESRYEALHNEAVCIMHPSLEEKKCAPRS